MYVIYLRHINITLIYYLIFYYILNWLCYVSYDFLALTHVYYLLHCTANYTVYTLNKDADKNEYSSLSRRNIRLIMEVIISRYCLGARFHDSVCVVIPDCTPWLPFASIKCWYSVEVYWFDTTLYMCVVFQGEQIEIDYQNNMLRKINSSNKIHIWFRNLTDWNLWNKLDLIKRIFPCGAYICEIADNCIINSMQLSRLEFVSHYVKWRQRLTIHRITT